MSFVEKESHREQGAPVELFLFWYGPLATQQFRFTNYTRDLEGPDGLYKTLPISHDAIKTDGKFEKNNLNIKVPITSELANLFLPYPPPGVVRVIIRQGHVSEHDPEYLVVWNGRVLSNSREANEATLTCDNTTTAYKRMGLRRRYQHGCSHLLYGERCGADKQAALHQATIVSIEGTGKVVLNDGWNGTRDPASFRGGTFNWNSPRGVESRTVINSDANSLTMSGQLRDVAVGMQVDIYLGCAHNRDDCANLHDNINNYGGQPWIPFKNPVKSHPYW